ncbi:hypothetical protein [Streptomyces sp. MZ04]|uniref:esterase/lipase family protein n=1 Tax=Streptomyces sp. MZ04 TaxID=2559236 RepID=UPI00107E7705|nr:hypothetical protein [Streptomyces sp. MZ04]TGA96429.1 hypothetical protein E2651_32500 [Streptomyces sp. MZ04]
MPEENAPTEQQIQEALLAAPPIALGTGPSQPVVTPAPVANEVWDLPGGTAWVYYGQGNQGLTRPVLMADGFNSGPSSLNDSWEFLDRGPYAFLTELRRRGRDVILIGYHDRSAPIQSNAETVTGAIFRTIAERLGDHPLAVGGFSMGGLVTRYTLAKLETQRMHHQTALYWSYDSPHRGAWIPIALQSFAHYIRKLNSAFSDQMNSPAAQQLLWRHIAEWDDTPAESPLRTRFLEELQRFGSWPRIPRTIGVANGMADGTGNGVAAGELAFEGKGLSVLGSRLNTQSPGEKQLVAQLRVVTPPPANEVHTPGLPPIDGAPGGTLNSFEILADRFNALLPILGFKSEAHIPSHSFVPAVSAVAIRDLDTEENLYTDIGSLSPEESELDDFLCASQNEGHTLITEELCTWIMDRLP